MTNSQLCRVSGLGLLIGAVAFVIHVVLRSLVTAGVDPSTFARQASWFPINALGVLGAALVLMGLPAVSARAAGQAGRPALVGAVLITAAWMFFGLFLSLYGLLVLPWLADQAPALVAASAPLPGGVLIAFIAALVAWLVGSVLLATPYLRGRMQPRWVGYLLPASALWVVAGDVIIAPNGPAANLSINLLSNLGPVLLLAAVGHLGFRIWSEQGPAKERPPEMKSGPEAGSP